VRQCTLAQFLALRSAVGVSLQRFNQFQMKVGTDPDIDIKRIQMVAAKLKSGNKLAADANCGWRQHDAVRVVSAVSDMSLYIEQPCETYEECRVVRDHTTQPMILDECMDSLRADEAIICCIQLSSIGIS
jgi:L-alanine-DL-glutamate epimerase-like enolase superfamily enzyme